MQGPIETPEEGFTFKTPRTPSAFHFLRPRAHPRLPRSILKSVTTVVAPLTSFAPTIIYTPGTGLRSPTSHREGSGPAPHPPCYTELLPGGETDVRAHSLFASRSATTGAHDRSGGELLWSGFRRHPAGAMCPSSTRCYGTMMIL